MELRYGKIKDIHYYNRCGKISDSLKVEDKLKKKSQMIDLVDKIKQDLNNNEIDYKQAFELILDFYNTGCDFIEKLIENESKLNKQLMKNLDLYKDLNQMNLYDQTFSQWNKSNLVLFDLKDILCRIGKNKY